MVDVTIRENITEMMAKVPEHMEADLAKVLLKAATFAGGKIGETVMTTFDNPSGELARSFLPARFVQTEEGVAAAAVSDLPYANIQDVGGTIFPKTVSHLAVPLTNEARNMWPRDWPQKELFFVEVKRTRNKLLAQRMSGGRIRPQYLLKDSVTIEGTDYLGRAMQASEEEINEILEHGIQEILDRADSESEG